MGKNFAVSMGRLNGCSLKLATDITNSRLLVHGVRVYSPCGSMITRGVISPCTGTVVGGGSIAIATAFVGVNGSSLRGVPIRCQLGSKIMVSNIVTTLSMNRGVSCAFRAGTSFDRLKTGRLGM